MCWKLCATFLGLWFYNNKIYRWIFIRLSEVTLWTFTYVYFTTWLMIRFVLACLKRILEVFSLCLMLLKNLPIERSKIEWIDFKNDTNLEEKSSDSLFFSLSKAETVSLRLLYWYFSTICAYNLRNSKSCLFTSFLFSTL